MRNAFADEVTVLASKDPRVVLLSGDIGNRLFDKLRAQTPNQFFNCGVAEQNMMGVAAGMGLSGLRPIVYTITPFTTVRCLEQIKVGVAYHNSPVIIVGTGSGLSYASLGPTHHSLEDFAIFRAIPNLTIFAPWDSRSLRECINTALESKGPSYIRIGKKGEPDLGGEDGGALTGGGKLICSGNDICILAVGTIAHEAVAAAQLLKQEGIHAEVILTHTVKPSPKQLFDNILDRFKCVITVEEHSAIGGFGESLLSHVAVRRLKRHVSVLGTDDKFMPVIGSQKFARSYFGLNSANISAVAKEIINEAHANRV